MPAWNGTTWAGRPNWRDGINERLEWQTDVLRHRDGSEQRRGLRAQPWRWLEYLFTYDDPQKRALLDNLLKSHKGELVLFPIWTDAERLSTTAASGQNVIQVATGGRDYDVGERVILVRDPFTYEVGEIQSMNATSLTLVDNLTSTWGAALTWVAPARPCFIQDGARGPRYAKDIKETRFLIQVSPGSVSTNRFASVSPTTYNGLDILKTPSSSNDDSDNEWVFDVRQASSGTGLVSRDAAAYGESDETIPYQKVFATKAKLSEFLGWLKRRDGRRVPFVWPSFDDDFQVISSENPELVVKYTGFADWLFGKPGRQRLAAICQSIPFNGFPVGVGDFEIYEIYAAVNNNDGTENIGIGGPNYIHSYWQHFRYSYLRTCRLESDSVEIQHHTDQVSEIRTRFRELSYTPV